MRSVSHLLRAVRRRLFRRTDVVIVRCRNPHAHPAKLFGLTVVRLNEFLGLDLALLDSTMCRAGELGIDMQARFRRGDEFFALRGSQGIVSFTWVTYADRREGSLCVHAAPGRAIIYNSFTMPQHRGRGLLTLLMQHMQCELVAEGCMDFVAGIHHGNASSLRSYDKSHFAPVAVARGLVIFNRFKFTRPVLVHDPRATALFTSPTALPVNAPMAAAGQRRQSSRPVSANALPNPAPNAGYPIQRARQYRAGTLTRSQE